MFYGSWAKKGEILMKIKLCMLYCVFFSITTAMMTEEEPPYAASKADTRPFLQNRSLSWQDFENSFRSQYAHLNIPEIQLTNNTQDPAYYHPLEKRIFINPHEREYSSADTMAGILLHEAGHHNDPQDKQDERIKHFAYSLTAITAANIGLNWAIFKPCILYKQRLSPLRAAASAMSLAITQCTVTLCANLFVRLPSERAADAFANTHATLPVLQAMKDFYKSLTLDQKIEKYNTLAREQNHPELSPYTVRIMRAINPFMSRIVPKIPDDHPHRTERRQSIIQAMKDRFNVSE